MHRNWWWSRSLNCLITTYFRTSRNMNMWMLLKVKWRMKFRYWNCTSVTAVDRFRTGKITSPNNGINHKYDEMHGYFANSLLEIRHADLARLTIRSIYQHNRIKNSRASVKLLHKLIRIRLFEWSACCLPFAEAYVVVFVATKWKCVRYQFRRCTGMCVLASVHCEVRVVYFCFVVVYCFYFGRTVTSIFCCVSSSAKCNYGVYVFILRFRQNCKLKCDFVLYSVSWMSSSKAFHSMEMRMACDDAQETKATSDICAFVCVGTRNNDYIVFYTI